MQMMVVEYARNVCALAGAHSEEMDPASLHPVIHLMQEQAHIDKMGGTMRLGAYPVTTNTSLTLLETYASPKALKIGRAHV